MYNLESVYIYILNDSEGYHILCKGLHYVRFMVLYSYKKEVKVGKNEIDLAVIGAILLNSGLIYVRYPRKDIGVFSNT